MANNNNNIYEFRMKDKESDIEIYHKFSIDEYDSECLFYVYENFIKFLEAVGYTYILNKIVYVEPEDMDKKVSELVKENKEFFG